MDVSFISARKILQALLTVLAPGASAVVLVKPQFEVGRGQVGRGGIVKDAALQLSALREVAEFALSLGYAARNACASPVTGASGNREFFLHLVPGADRLAPAALDTALRKAVAP